MARPGVEKTKPVQENGRTKINTTNTNGKKPEPKNVDIDKKVDGEIVYEFGGPVGVTAMMVFFPCLMYYMWICVEFYQGRVERPTSLDDIVPFGKRMLHHVITKAYPSWWGFVTYSSFCVLQAFLAYFAPGPTIKGLPIPSEKNQQLEYLCNGVSSWYIILVISFVLNYTGVFRLSSIVDHFGELLTWAIIYGTVITWITYFVTVALGKQHRMSGSLMYDVFMGAALNPRIGRLDLKMWAEIRIPWVILFYVSTACALKEYEQTGAVSPSIAFMVLAHFLYVNACMKGEECIPTTWDIFYEKWGFMLIFWNMAGVPFTYCISSLYIIHNGPITLPTWFVTTLFVALLSAYYVWDTANSQKNRFRMQLRGTFIERHTFPQLPWGTLHNPSYIKTSHGNLLLTDGWWGIARKIHYTADLVMAISWGLITGVGSFFPYFYFLFFFFVLTHRVSRDMQRCKKKYGKDWEAYCKRVPYIFIPGIY